MSAFKNLVSERHVGSVPKAYADFLVQPVADDPTKANASYENWEFDHASHRRFFVGGMRWFLRTTDLKAVDLTRYTDAAVRAAAIRPQVVNMPNSDDKWNALSRNQIRAAREKEPMFFQKAVLTIIACELALADLLNSDKRSRLVASGVSDASDVYRHMAVVPAVWNIDNFSTAYDAIKRSGPDAIGQLLAAAGQRSPEVFEGLAGISGKGATVTYETARRIRDGISALPLANTFVGKVRASPGNFLGRGNAMAEEEAELD